MPPREHTLAYSPWVGISLIAVAAVVDIMLPWEDERGLLVAGVFFFVYFWSMKDPYGRGRP